MTAAHGRPVYPRKDSALNLFDYLDTRLETFDEAPLTPVDSAALSQFCMVRGEGIIPAARNHANGLVDRLHALVTRPAHFSDLHRAENYDGLFCGLAPGDVKRELAALAASPRFRDLELRDYASVFDEESNTQFAAITFVWSSPTAASNNFAYIGFRGTDDSFTGWRENFEMAVDPPVPAQRLAAEYLVSVARHLPRRLYVGGHSKGGNLATYAALRAPEIVRARFAGVFDHDGPGFKQGFLSERDFEPVLGVTHRMVPEESVVGMLMETPVPTCVVRSSAHGLDQHNVFTWEVEGEDFADAERLSSSAVFTHEVMSEWLASLGEEELPRVVDALFKAIEASGASSVGEVIFSGPNAPALLGEAARNIDQESRDVLLPALKKLAAAVARAGVRGITGRL